MKNQNKECNGALYSGDGKVFLKLLNQECCYYAVENGTESISDNAFATLSFSNKTEFLDLPDSVTKLGSGAFQRMALNSIAIPPKVTEIPEKLLFGCTNPAGRSGMHKSGSVLEVPKPNPYHITT